MDITQWKFISVILTFTIIAIICIIKGFKSGVLAASIGIFITMIIWGVRQLVLKISSYFTGDGLKFKDIKEFIIYISIAIISFIIISVFIEIKSRNHIR